MTDKTEPTVEEGKADVHPSLRPRAEKYGMPIEYADRIVQRHFGVTDEQAALAGGQLAADIEVSNVLAKKG